MDTVVSRSQEGVVIQLLINEGDPVNVVSLTITGTDGVIARDDLLNHIPLRVDDAFDRFAMRASADSITSYLQNRGYPFAQVFTNFDMDVLEHTGKKSFHRPLYGYKYSWFAQGRVGWPGGARRQPQL